jgi:CDP-diacylglycerol--glycerol-3-phosphate 3-phosphatidyltransferase
VARQPTGAPQPADDTGFTGNRQFRAGVQRAPRRTAGLLILLGGFFDILDGRVARVTGLAASSAHSTTPRSTDQRDRGVPRDAHNDYRLSRAMSHDLPDHVAMAGSLMISYTRARAEALGLDCKVGLMPRAERVVLIGVAALAFGEAWDGLVLKVVIAVLAVTTNLTAFQRIAWVHRHARGVPLDDAPARQRDTQGDRVVTR